MRYAVLADIHSNIEALHAVLLRIGELEADRIVCLGDIVGYNADPNLCVELIKDLSITTVAGNHDVEAASKVPPYNMTETAERSILWTREVLTKENKEFLRTLPHDITVDNRFIALHSPRDTTNKYIRSKYAAAAVFKLMQEAQTQPIAFLGHTHSRSIFSTKVTTETKASPADQERVESHIIETEININIKEDRLYLINPGSVGQPRDGDPRASFLIFDAEAGEVEFYLIPYPTETTARKIRDAGLPEINAKRLTLGQ